MSFIKNIDRWRTEISLAEDFRNKEFGEYTDKKRVKAGENIDYFEKGFSTGLYSADEYNTTTINFFHVIAKLIVPSLYFQNPQVMTKPKRKTDQDSAPYAKGIMNHFYKEIGVDSENETAVWDAYVLNRGIAKVGYATKFGMDIEDDEKKTKKNIIDRTLEKLGLKKPEEKEVIRPEINQKIVAEYPYVKWVSPFKFLIDPRARNIDEALWVAEEFDKTVGELKRNKFYKNTSQLKGTSPDFPTEMGINVPQTEIDEFSIVRVYEIHYRNRSKMYRLVIAKDGDVFQELYHEQSIYKIDGFQYDILEFNRHGHLQFKRSDLTKIKNLQDRLTSTFDMILDQIDRFIPKVAYDSTAVSVNGVKALRDGNIGALVECNKNPREVIAEINLTQLKADLKAVIDQMVTVITMMTGVTQAKILGISSGDTATGENIAQGGENIRLADMSKSVQQFVNKQATKIWQIVTQFVDLEELEIITGESGVNPATGQPTYSWLADIDSGMSEKLIQGQYAFDIEVGSTQKVDSALITKRIENLISILGRTDVIALMQQQGKKVDLAEILRLWLLNNPEIVRDPGRIIQDVGPQTQGLLPAQEILMGGGQGGVTPGSAMNEMRSMRAEATPSQPSIRQETAQL